MNKPTSNSTSICLLKHLPQWWGQKLPRVWWLSWVSCLGSGVWWLSLLTLDWPGPGLVLARPVSSQGPLSLPTLYLPLSRHHPQPRPYFTLRNPFFVHHLTFGGQVQNPGTHITHDMTLQIYNKLDRISILLHWLGWWLGLITYQ